MWPSSCLGGQVSRSSRSESNCGVVVIMYKQTHGHSIDIYV